MPPIIESPCKSVCVIADFDGAKLCFGCFRTPEEIGAWRSLSPEERRRIMAELPHRQPEHWRRINRGVAET